MAETSRLKKYGKAVEKNQIKIDRLLAETLTQFGDVKTHQGIYRFQNGMHYSESLLLHSLTKLPETIITKAKKIDPSISWLD